MTQSGRRVVGVVIVVALGLLVLAVLLPPLCVGLPAPVRPDAGVRTDAGFRRTAERPTARSPVRPLRAAITRDATATAGSFSGRVVSATRGTPVAGAELSFIRGGIASSVVCGKDGAFAFSPNVPGTYTLATVTAAGFLPFAPELGQSPITLVLLPGVRITDVVIALTPAVEYLGVVHDPEGRPVEGARVRIIGPGEPGPGELQAAGAGEAPLAPLPDRFVSDARGEFRFRAPDGAVLEARHEGFAPARARLDFGAQVSHRLVLRLSAPRAAAPLEAISGRVLGGDGAPVAGVGVTAEALPGAPGPGAGPGGREPPPVPPVRTRTDADGRFTLEGLEPGRYDLAASRRAVAVAWARGVPVGTRDVVLRLAAAGRLTGTVRDGGRAEPVAAFTVIVVRCFGPVARETAAVRAFFDSRGTYAVDDLAAGDYEVTVAAHGFAVPARKPVSVGAGAAAVADFELGRGARLAGQVVDGATRQPLEGAAVSLEGRAGLTGSVPLATRATTDAGGRFLLEGLPPGRSSLFVAAAGHHARIVGPLTVGAEPELPPVVVDLTPVRDGETPSIELVGIGAVLKAEGEGLVVQDVVAGGGAAEVGLRPGDVLLAVEGQPVATLGFDGSIQLIRGPEGTTVRLLVRRQGGAPEEVLAPRRRLRR